MWAPGISFIENHLLGEKIIRKLGKSAGFSGMSNKAGALSIVNYGPIYAISEPNQSLFQRTDGSDLVLVPADSNELHTEGIKWFPERWNEGEGGIDWKGTSSLSGRTNFFRVTWETSQIVGFVAEVTNLNNDYDVNVGYSFWAYASAGGPLLRDGFLIVASVADEDWYTPPSTVYDREAGTTVNVRFGYIEFQRSRAFV